MAGFLAGNLLLCTLEKNSPSPLKMPLVRYLTILLLFTGNSVFGDNEIDSLKNLLESHKKEDTIRVKTLIELAYYLKGRQPDDALEVVVQALDISRRLNYKRGVARSYYQIGTIYENKDNYPTAIQYFKLSLRTYETLGDSSRSANILNKIGGCHKDLLELDQAYACYKKALDLSWRLHDSVDAGGAYINIGLFFKESNKPDSAIHYFKLAYELKKKINDPGGAAAALYNTGTIYLEFGDHKKALEYMLQAVEPMKKSGNERGYAAVINGIGALYFYQKEYENALVYFDRAKKIYEELHDRSGVSDAINNMANIYIDQNKYDKAIEYFNQCIEIEKEIGNQVEIGAAFMNLGNAYRSAKQPEKAYPLLEQAIALIRPQGNARIKAHVLRSYGNVLVEVGKVSQGIPYILEALTLTKQQDSKVEIVDNYQSLANAYSKAGDYEKAYQYSLLHASLKDSVFTETNSAQIKEMTVRYETESKEKEIQSLTQRTSIQDLAIKKKKWFLYSSAGGGVLVLIITGLVFSRFRIRQRSNKELETQNNEIVRKKNIIEEKNREITSSIYFAKRIQDSILPTEKYLKKHLPKSTVMFRPKDIVSGDFYFFEQVGDLSIIAAADCTGHGVPGAFMSMVGHDVLEQAVKQQGLTQPSLILNYLSKSINSALRQEGQDSAIKDGMDIALCTIDHKKMELQYAGAFNPLYHIRNFELSEIKADKFAIGSYFDANKHSFTNHTISLQKGDSVFLFSDGYADQFGGELNKKFKLNRFKSLLIGVSEQEPAWQLEVLNHNFDEWKGSNEQVDDILVIGIKF